MLLGGACLLYGLFVLLLIKPWNGPSGFDIYYYALQIKALEGTGSLLFRDFSPVYPFSLLIDRFVSNPVLAVQITAVISGLFCFGGLSLLLLGRKGEEAPVQGRAGRIALLLLGVVNPLFFFLYWEFTKNLFALGLFLLGFGMLWTSSYGWAEEKGQRILFHMAGLLLLILAGISHRLIAVLVLLLGAQYGLRIASEKIGEALLKRRIVSLLFGAGLILTLSAGVVSWNLWYDRLSSLSLKAPLGRLILMSGKNLDPIQKAFFLFLQIFIPLSLVFLFIKRKSIDWGKFLFQPGFLFYLLGQVMVFPFLSFGWDDIGFRLFLLAPLFLVLCLLLSDLSVPVGAATLLFLFAGIFAAQGILSDQTERAPDYRTLGKELQGLELHLEGRKLICHRGAAGYIWYEKGVWTENFRPADGMEKEYDRLVYGFRPEIFTPYLEGEELPGFSSGSYTLVPEIVWKRFYEQNRDMYFLKSELNPYLPRPSSGFAIDEEVAAVLSPKTFLTVPDTEQ